MRKEMFPVTKYLLYAQKYIFCFFLMCACSISAGRHILQPLNPFSKNNTQIGFEGIVMERMPSPMFWAGDIPSFQGIRYKVIRVTEGEIPDDEITVFHVLVGPPLCERNEPILSMSIFKIGTRLRVIAEKTLGGDYVCWEKKEYVSVLDK